MPTASSTPPRPRGVEADLGEGHADILRDVQHPDPRADRVLANPPFKGTGWFRANIEAAGEFRAVSKLELASAA